MNYTLHLGDCLAEMVALGANSIDTIITDPPYGISFMGKDWDHGIPGPHFWEEALRAAKPGAMLLAFGGTRTFHRLTCAIEDAGWEIRDCLMWLYGTGFPKSHDISKAIDKAEGAERKFLGYRPDSDGRERWKENGGAIPRANTILGTDSRALPASKTLTAPATDAAQEWNGWGTTLKPAWEPIIVAMKPLDGTFAQNAVRHGVAGLNIDGARIGTSKRVPGGLSRKAPANCYGKFAEYGETLGVGGHDPNLGRWPANLLLDEEAAAMLDAQSGKSTSSDRADHQQKQSGTVYGWANSPSKYKRTGGHFDTGGASRFFYVAKASRSEREDGVEGMPKRGGHLASPEGGGGGWAADVDKNPNYPRANYHPTVKPLALMRYLCTLTATPTGGTVLDPFMGSGTTGVACMQTGRNFIGCEIDPGYFEIAKKRIENAAAQPPLIPHEKEPQPEQSELL